MLHGSDACHRLQRGACLCLLLTACERSDASGRIASPAASPQPTGAAEQQAAAKAEPRCTTPWSARAADPVPPAADCPAPDRPLGELRTGSLRFVDAKNAPVLRVERAETNDERMLGLMYRTAMDEDAGMVFSWPEEQPRSFWMKNTCLPLDMLFIDKDDFIVGILEQVPTLNEAPRRVACPASRVLEVNAGFCRRHGVAPGQRVAVDF
jgi:hypothetical protein